MSEINQPQKQRLAMGFSEVAEATGLSVNFLRNEEKRGRLKVRSFGRRRLVLMADLQAYLADDSDAAERLGASGETKAA
jgi:hypothetical protein